MADDLAFGSSGQKLAFPGSPSDDDQTKGMNDIERNNYGALRAQGLLPNESRYHATNPAGRLYPPSTPDPWDEKGS